MSNVYIVTSGQYSDYGIDAVFSTLEAAENYADIRRRITDDVNEIEKYALDEHEGRPIVTAEVSADGGVDILSFNTSEYFFPRHKVCRVKIHYNEDRSIMEKAARDRAAMIRARAEGL